VGYLPRPRRAEPHAGQRERDGHRVGERHRVALVAACSGERRAATHATFSFRISATQPIEGTAGDIVRHADELARLRHRYLDTLSAATGQDQQLLARQIDRGHPQSAAEAITFGIVDTIANTKEPK